MSEHPTQTSGMAALAGPAHRATDPLHSMIYFAPEPEQQYVSAGLRPGRMGYFASRSAAMGAVSAPVTTATFVNFNADLVARFIPRAWTLASLDTILAARLRGADLALRRLLGDEVDSPQLQELAELTRAACAALSPEGRPLYAAHAALAWPEDPHLVLWHAATLLREFRGDGHTIALVRAGMSGLDSIITHCATGRGFTVAAAKHLRGWSDEQWAAAQAGLATRGLLTGDELTPAGVTLRAEIEDETDRLDTAAWEHVGPDTTRRVIELGKGLTRTILTSGAFATPGVFAAARSASS